MLAVFWYPFWELVLLGAVCIVMLPGVQTGFCWITVFAFLPEKAILCP